MFYSEDVVAEVRSLNNVVDVVGDYVKLVPRAGNHFGLCPFHSERTPSFSVNNTKQIFYCFGCGAGGNVISFIMRIERLDFLDALKSLADRVNYTLPEKSTGQSSVLAASREITSSINKRAAKFYYEYLTSDTEEALSAREYLQNRSISSDYIRRFGIGLSPNSWDSVINHLSDVYVKDLEKAGLVKQNEKTPERFYDRFRGRVMFPIIDNRGRVVAFGGRLMDDKSKEAKYINTPETPLFHKSDHLYGINIAKKAHGGELYVVEGYMDVIAMHRHGFANTVGVLGTSLTESHIRVLRGAGVKTVTLIMDTDNAGKQAIERAIPILRSGNIKTRVLELIAAKDPDEFLTKYGARGMHKILPKSKTAVQFQMNQSKSRHNMDSTEGRIDFTKEVAKILSDIPSEIEIDAYAGEIASEVGLSASAILAEIERQKQGTNEPVTPAQVLRPRIRGEDVGLTKAKKNLLALLFNCNIASQVLFKLGVLTPEDMEDEFYGKLLEFAFLSGEKKQTIQPADLMNLFEDLYEQQLATEIFVDTDEFSDNEAVEKALSNMVKRIKLAVLKKDLDQIGDDYPEHNRIIKKIDEITNMTITLEEIS